MELLYGFPADMTGQLGISRLSLLEFHFLIF